MQGAYLPADPPAGSKDTKILRGKDPCKNIISTCQSAYLPTCLVPTYPVYMHRQWFMYIQLALSWCLHPGSPINILFDIEKICSTCSLTSTLN